MPVIYINMASTSEMSNRDVIIAFKEREKNNARSKFQAYLTEGLEVHGLKITGRKQAQTMNAIVEGI